MKMKTGHGQMVQDLDTMLGHQNNPTMLNKNTLPSTLGQLANGMMSTSILKKVSSANTKVKNKIGIDILDINKYTVCIGTSVTSAPPAPEQCKCHLSNRQSSVKH